MTVTYALHMPKSEKAADCAIYYLCHSHNFEVAFHSVCSLLYWILCKSSCLFLNFAKLCFIFKSQVHHKLKELFGFIVAYLLQTFIWSHISHKLLLMFWSTSKKVEKYIKKNQTLCFWVTAEHSPETHKQE